MSDMEHLKTSGFNGIWERVSGEISSLLCAVLGLPLPPGPAYRLMEKFQVGTRCNEWSLECRVGLDMIRLQWTWPSGVKSPITVSVFERDSSGLWTAILQITLTPIDSARVCELWGTTFPFAYEPIPPSSSSSSDSTESTANKPSRLPAVS